MENTIKQKNDEPGYPYDFGNLYVSKTMPSTTHFGMVNSFILPSYGEIGDGPLVHHCPLVTGPWCRALQGHALRKHLVG